MTTSKNDSGRVANIMYRSTFMVSNREVLRSDDSGTLSEETNHCHKNSLKKSQS